MAGVFDWLPPGLQSQIPNRPTFNPLEAYYGPSPTFAAPTSPGDIVGQANARNTSGLGSGGMLPGPGDWQHNIGGPPMPAQTPYMPGLGQYTRDPAGAFHKRQNEFPNLPQQPGVGTGGVHAPVINDVHGTTYGAYVGAAPGHGWADSGTQWATTSPAGAYQVRKGQSGPDAATGWTQPQSGFYERRY